MIFADSPHGKQIAVISGIVIVVGLLFWYNTQYQPYYYGEGVMGQSAGEPSMMRDAMVEDSYDISTKSATNEKYAMMPTIAPSPDSGSVAVDVPATERLVIKNGSMSILVDNVAVAVGQIKQFAIEKGGFVVTSEIDTYDNDPTGSVEIRIPSTVFDTNLGTVRVLGEVQSERTDGQDVTEEYVDLQARLDNLKASETQFLSIMKQAVKIEDILAVQRELTNVRGQIESMEGRMKYLKESAAFSSLTVYLSTNPEQLPVLDNGNTWKPLATVKDALRGLQDLGKKIVDVFIWVAVYIPLWIVLILVIWMVRRWYRKTQQ
ncbi:MAG: hypothetical protein CO029_02595 [Candidatus Magasanikbacteria bacterium CG_4_9_14_0_2_um_filter_41_10]|uniref:DUF4349 domain-containing protein n=1 Tax=Candidatus Magasanikbacteria bacterium CG_4_10_14_0_2_um_filter_41_31 TaxID=1974639 RepID=A0A2M7V2D3_9BACT|nr:MAG: hypothetical protein AUJ37_00445 [Candidatus Magasanikbacteria bacterium CG1_02_41_34]PIZ92579.1 MAG: hypothetical protein COX83_03950 [Candidatus Magasanikbacteria bacterium CG_4_10_14_0_2_um_filter_41_31]PJC53474.1 MAG: hypothetical protein CO029_02595 [Candidatus Magasanikbacteria bacterium CG_4_9_14_0_2_um_filter_41_10]